MFDMQQVIFILEELGNGGQPFQEACGLCYNIRHWPSRVGDYYIDMTWLKDYELIMKSWPKYSGDESYPVPHPELDPTTAYMTSTTSLWTGEYGENRREYARYLAAEFKKVLAAEKHE